MPEGNGSWHSYSWHSYELNEKIKQQVPIDVLKEMLKKNMITNAQYKNFCKFKLDSSKTVLQIQQAGSRVAGSSIC
ncbi:MAG: hypothetical protein HQK52_15755 [Oligoflexia bacterium]|nr:hypothetical protein [Oligoflexia bacterium]